MSLFNLFKKGKDPSSVDAKKEEAVPPHYAKREFNTNIAKENILDIIPNLIALDPLVQSSLSLSVCYDKLNPLPITSSETKTSVRVVNADSFDCAGELNSKGLTDIAVLNMASAICPGGGYTRGARAQDESLCRRSTLYNTIKRSGFYPIPPYGGLYSPKVLVFRTSDLTSPACELLPAEERWWTSVISVAGIRRPPLTIDWTDFAREGDREGTRERIR